MTAAPTDRELAAAPTLKVMRHGGRRTHQWRVLYEGTDRAKANACYDKEFAAIRCGSLVLLENGKKIRAEYSGNNLTRW